MAEAQRIDDLDRSIITHLTRDASATNRALADAIGVTEQTIAARIRRLEEANLLRVVGLLDADAVGYGLFVIVGIQVAGRSPADVAVEVAALPFVNGVSSCLGGFELMASLYARDERDLFELLARKDVREPSNWSRRFKNHQEKLKSGDVYQVAEVVRNLALRDLSKGLSAGEKAMFTKARDVLVSELSVALDVTEDEALEQVQAQFAPAA